MTREALAHYDQALRINPDYAQAQISLAKLLATAAPASGGNPGRAVALAERACQLIPDKSAYLTILGMAQYRLGRYEEALKTLERADKLNSAGTISTPRDLAFRAMTQHRLGRKEEAKKTFERLREVMAKAEWAKNAEAQSLLREASTYFGANK